MSGLEPIVLASLIGAGGAVASSGIGALGGGGGGSFAQGAPIPQQAMIPPGFEEAYKMAAQLAMQRMGEPQYVAPINPLSMGGANIASQFYQGQPYQQPQLQQYRPGQGSLGMPGQGMPQVPGQGMGGMPGGHLGKRMEPGAFPGMPMGPMSGTPGIPGVPGGVMSRQQIPMPGMPSPIGGAPWMQGGGRPRMPM